MMSLRLPRLLLLSLSSIVVLALVLPVADASFFRPLCRIVVHPSTITTNQSKMSDVRRGGGQPRRPPGLFKLFSKSDDDTKKALKNKGVQVTRSTFEGLVRKMVNKPDYKFGDISKTYVSAGTTAIETVVKKTTGNGNYQFGDLTKGTISTVSKAGSNVLSYSEMTLSLMTEANINELVQLGKLFWLENMDADQRREVFVVIIYLGAVAVLAYNLVANINAGLVNAAAWTMTSAKLGASPLTVAGGWDAFLRNKQTLDLAFSGPLLPARVAITIPIFFLYQRCIRGLGVVLPLRRRFPILNRVASLLFMWVGVNLTTYSAVSVGFAWIGSLISGVPLR